MADISLSALIPTDAKTAVSEVSWGIDNTLSGFII